MAQYTKVSKNGQVRYMLDGAPVRAAEVPTEVKDALAAVKDGQPVDESGNTVESGDGVEGGNNNAPTPNNEKTDDDESDEDDASEDDEEDDKEEPTSDPAAPAPPANPKSEKLAKDAKALNAKKAKESEKADAEPQQNPVDSGLKQDEAGMGFPRKNGYTADIFDINVPHTHVRNVNGLMVPLSENNYRTKTDAEIMRQVEELRKKGKVTV